MGSQAGYLKKTLRKTILGHQFTSICVSKYFFSASIKIVVREPCLSRLFGLSNPTPRFLHMRIDNDVIKTMKDVVRTNPSRRGFQLLLFVLCSDCFEGSETVVLQSSQKQCSNFVKFGVIISF